MLCVALSLFGLFVPSTYGEPKSQSSAPNYTDRFNEFDWHISKAVGASTKHNVLISPVSIKLVLAMLYEGASGTTAKELGEVLKIEKGPGPSQRFSNILQSLQVSNSGYELDVGMKLFIDKEALPKKSYADKISNLYNATIDSINFKNTTAAVAHINGWARSVTRGHIKHLLSEADAHHNTLMLLLNAVYFKGIWNYPFSPNATKEGTFMADTNTPVLVEYMNGVQTLSYYDSVDLKSSILRLPYVGEKFAMYIILPDNGTTLDKVIANLTPTKVRTCISEMMQVTVNISLPKFNFEFASSLAPVLKQLGITEIFSNKADLRNIAEGPTDPVVSNVIQKAAIEVNELGTVAAVVTAVELVNKFGMHTISFNVSRPFLFFIEDETTNTVVFIGKVVNPVAPGIPIVSSAYPSPTVPETSESISSIKPQATTASSGPSNNETVILSSPSLAQRFPEQDEQSLNPFYYFDIQLLQGVSQEDKNNWVISPSSIKSTLGILLEGASKSTALEISHLLRLPLDVNAARSILHNIQQTLRNPPNGIFIKSGSSILVRQGLGINNEFRRNAENHYSAPLTVFNFSNPDLISKQVNKWIKGLTNGYIQEIISPESMSSDAILLLANAIFFKGNWKVEFNSLESRTTCFYTPQCTKVKMMTTTGAFKYGQIKNLNARVLELPYENPRYSMIILLPNDKTGLQRIAWDLPFNSFLGFLDSLVTIEIDIMMPKFSVEYSVELKPILQKLGVSEIFSDKADFSELFHPGTIAKVSGLIHRSKIEVTEKGTVAAGSTVAQFQLLSSNNKPRFVVDRPFYFFVRDYETGFLFEGQITDIQSAQGQAKITEVSGAPLLKIRRTTTDPPTKKLEIERGSILTHSYPFYTSNNTGQNFRYF